MTWLARLIVLWIVVADLRPLCRSTHWFPYWEPDEFGYAEWRCQKPLGHSGDHRGSR